MYFRVLDLVLARLFLDPEYLGYLGAVRGTWGGQYMRSTARVEDVRLQR